MRDGQYDYEDRRRERLRRINTEIRDRIEKLDDEIGHYCTSGFPVGFPYDAKVAERARLLAAYGNLT